MKAKVVKYFDEKGYGFVRDENGESRFFHISDVVDGKDVLVHKLNLLLL